MRQPVSSSAPSCSNSEACLGSSWIHASILPALSSVAAHTNLHHLEDATSSLQIAAVRPSNLSGCILERHRHHGQDGALDITNPAAPRPGSHTQAGQELIRAVTGHGGPWPSGQVDRTWSTADSPMKTTKVGTCVAEHAPACGYVSVIVAREKRWSARVVDITGNIWWEMPNIVCDGECAPFRGSTVAAERRGVWGR